MLTGPQDATPEMGRKRGGEADQFPSFGTLLEVNIMTLIKSLLLGSAAGIFAVASAQAADLPTKKGAPAVEYVKVCKITVAGKPVVGFTLPGSDTCMHFTGYITAQVEAGDLETGFSYGTNNNAAGLGVARVPGTGLQARTAADPLVTAAPANPTGPRAQFRLHQPSEFRRRRGVEYCGRSVGRPLGNAV